MELAKFGQKRVLTSISRFVKILYLYMEMSMCARLPVPEFRAQAHMLIFMYEYKILTNLEMLVNTRFLSNFDFAHHYLVNSQNVAWLFLDSLYV